MGKQINYWMEYNSFFKVAQKAVELGCTIVKYEPETGKVTESIDISIVKDDNQRYYFHLSEAGPIEIEVVNNQEKLKHGYCASVNAIIEAGYSFIVDEKRKKVIRRARLYCISGYYDDAGEYISRPECLTRVYNSLVRFVKKVAPYTELTDVIISSRSENYGQKVEFKHKEYVTEVCLKKRNNEGYIFQG